ncbi:MULTISPECIES: ChrR family anti-sigma-E factor [Pseudoalteromonas]|uniref:Transcriptional regulator n=1 Tax=Pseudoalteromonas amylolytica TaxID=1859457 RepID=A0A1S1N0M7_9GAMM|nr:MULTISPECIES: ChrR family anti-sigma-E factor [Pseudoalteromonas]MCF6434376.1 ChrR family anti-sigma-E factor [Pseudoalteromonas sp. MMG022]OHU85414.1 transcriptional regulator [Pseudoalteromonas sp. JW3]OHU92965.1 transcriptional regulator [Pseudoalteromonas amylolytica]
MIKHHPTEQLLIQFSQGALPATLSIAVAAHLELCECCRIKVQNLEQSNAEALFTDFEDDMAQDEFANLFEQITANDDIDMPKGNAPQTLNYQNKTIELPRAIANSQLSSFVQLGKLARARLQVDDGELRASLLQIAAGGEIPHHTHTGFELTLLLDGEFSDESGAYVPGDFIWLDGRHHHSPATESGCLCFTVVNSALHFNKGLSKLLNPIGNLIY